MPGMPGMPGMLGMLGMLGAVRRSDKGGGTVPVSNELCKAWHGAALCCATGSGACTAGTACTACTASQNFI